MKKYVNKKNIIIVVVLLVLLLLVSAIRKNNAPMTDGQIITNLSRLTTIPDVNIDTPLIAAIDTTKPQQKFFDGAQKGDVVIIFLKSQKAYVYSPSRNIIVNSGPLDTGETKAKVSESTKLNASTSVATTTKNN
jgi:hypothetical protein